MKYSLSKFSVLLVVINSFISVSIAQNSNNQKGFGKFYDINGLPLNDYCDFDYAPEKVLKISLVLGEKETPGAYYDLQGAKHEGLITIDKMTHEFSFKDSNSGATVLHPESCLGIKLGIDSFAVIKDFEIQKAFAKSIVKVESFVEVIAKTSAYTLYKYTRYNQIQIAFDNTLKETFVIKADTSTHLVSILNSETLIRYFRDCPLLKRQIANKYLTIDDLPSISKMDEYFHKYETKSKIFYSSSWDEQKDSANSAYYSNIVSIRDTIWELGFFNNAGTSLYLGHFISFSPSKKDGEFLWYYPDGQVRKKIIYKKNEISGPITEYYTNGNLHYVYKVKQGEIEYERILDKTGKDVLSKNGKGEEEVFDSVFNRKITQRYDEFKLLLSAYMNDKGKLVAPQCDQNAMIKSFNALQRQMDKSIVYPEKSFKNYRHGLVLVQFTVDAEGNTVDFKIIKGLDTDCDNQITKFLTEQTTKWRPAKLHGNPFMQEIIVPFYFEISGMTLGRNNTFFYDNWMWRNQWQQFPQPKLNLPPTPTFRMR